MSCRPKRSGKLKPHSSTQWRQLHTELSMFKPTDDPLHFHLGFEKPVHEGISFQVFICHRIYTFGHVQLRSNHSNYLSFCTECVCGTILCTSSFQNVWTYSSIYWKILRRPVSLWLQDKSSTLSLHLTDLKLHTNMFNQIDYTLGEAQTTDWTLRWKFMFIPMIIIAHMTVCNGFRNYFIADIECIQLGQLWMPWLG